MTEFIPEPMYAASSRRRRWRHVVRPAVAATVVAGTVVLLRLSGSLSDMNATLQDMGFDPDRARLLTALSGEAIVIAVGTLVTGARLAVAVAGATAGLALFTRTFLRETQAAMSPSAGQGTFDAVGWIMTLAALTVAVLIVAWATVVLSLIVREQIARAVAELTTFVGGRRSPARLGRPAVALAVAALLAITIPTFGDIVNYTPDVHMRTGSAATVGRTQPSNGSLSSAPPPLPTIVLDNPTVAPGGTIAGVGGGSAGAVLVATHPWSRSPPTGAGIVTTITFRSPWVGGTQSTSTVWVYLPPGYRSSARRYPVIYEVPRGLPGGWTTAVHITSLMDNQIDAGAIPATIVVFPAEKGGPFPDSECADAANHREWFESYLTSTVLPYVDSNFRTIPSPAARALMGFSEGGFCAPMLALRHPDLFASAISFCGYFVAGIRSPQTPQAWRPFGGDRSLESAYSPETLASQIRANLRGSMFFELSANPREFFYGTQYSTFAEKLHGAGIPVALFPTSAGHSWSSPRELLPQVLTTLGERETALGVFS